MAPSLEREREREREKRRRRESGTKRILKRQKVEKGKNRATTAGNRSRGANGI